MIRYHKIPQGTLKKIIAPIIRQTHHLYRSRLHKLPLKQIGIAAAAGIVLIVGTVLLWPPSVPVQPERVVELLCPNNNAFRPKEITLARMIQRIAAGGNINATDDEGNTALILAAQVNNRAAICWLVAKGADVKRKNKIKKTALDYAENNKLRDLFETCMREDEPAKPSEKDQRYALMNTPKSLAWCFGEFSAYSLSECFSLLQSGADITKMAANMFEQGGSDRTEYMAFFIRHGCDMYAAAELADHSFNITLDDDGLNYFRALNITPPFIAAFAPKDTQQDAAESTPQPAEIEGRTPLFHAIAAHDAKRVRELLDEGADVNVRDKISYTPLLLAIDNCTEGDDYAGSEIVRMLLEAKADTEATRKDERGNQNAFTLLICNVDHFASHIDYDTRRAPALERTLRYMIDAKVRLVDHALMLLPKGISGRGVSPRVGKFATMLLDAGVKPDNKIHGSTGLHTIGCYDAKIARRLIEGGVDVNSRSRECPSALLGAQTDEIFNLLLKAGANPNVADSEGRTPLFHAILAQNAPRVKALLDAKANVNRRDNKKSTPLLLAIENCMKGAADTGIEIVHMLLEAGAKPDVYQSDEKGSYNALTLLISKASERAKDADYATTCGPIYEKILQLLLDAKAKVPSHALTLLPKSDLPVLAPIATMLLEGGADPLSKSTDGNKTTSLMTAGLYHVDLTRKLIEAGVDPKAADTNGDTALHFARNAKVVKALLDAGADANAKNNESATALHFVDSAETASLLVKAGADVNAVRVNRWNQSYTPLDNILRYYKAPTDQLLGILDALLEGGAEIEGKDVRGRSWSALASISYGSTLPYDIYRKAAARLVKAGADINKVWHAGNPYPAEIFIDLGLKVEKTALLNPLSCIDIDALIKAGADINAQDDAGNTPLIQLIRDDDKNWQMGKLVALYLKHGADATIANKRGETATSLAKSESLLALLEGGVKAPDCIEPLVEDLGKARDAEVNEINRKCLLIALKKQKAQAPQDILLKVPHGFNDINVFDPHLHFSRRVKVPNGFNDLEVFDALIRAGADPKAVDKDGKTTLMIAGTANAEIARKLIEAGVDPKACAADGSTALHLAEHAEIAKLLIEAGADVNAKNNEGNTPLHNTNGEIVPCLIQAGADIEGTNAKGLTPLRANLRYLDLTAASELVKHGAKVTGENWDAFQDFAYTQAGNSSEVYLQLCKQLIEAGADVNKAWKCGYRFSDTVNAKEMLDLGADPLWRDEQGNTTLILRTDEAHTLCAAGVDINATNNQGNTALMIMVQNSSNIGTYNLDKYISLGADLNISNNEGLTMLQIARRKRYNDRMIQYMINKGAAEVSWKTPNLEDLLCPLAPGQTDRTGQNLEMYESIKSIRNGNGIDQTGPKGQSALMLAARLNNRLVAAWLIAKGANVTLKNINGETAYDLSSSIALRELLTICAKEKEPLTSDEEGELEERAATPEAKQKALFEYGRYVEKLSILLKGGAQPNKTGQDGSLLMENGMTLESAAYLLRHGYNVNTRRTDGKLPSRNIVDKRTTEDLSADIVRLLMAMGMQVDTKDKLGTLCTMILCDDVQAVQTQLKQNAQLIHSKTPAGASLLSLAQSSEMAKALVSAGANVKERFLLRAFAKRPGSGPILETLRQLGAILPGVDDTGKSLLHLAQSADMIEPLVKYGVKINHRDKFDLTALHYAAADFQADTVEALLKHGADVNALNKHWGAPLSFIFAEKNRLSMIGGWINSSYRPHVRAQEEARRHMDRVLNLLLDHGAKANEQTWYSVINAYCQPSEFDDTYLPEKELQPAKQRMVLSMIRHKVPLPKDILTHIPCAHYDDPLSRDARNWLAKTLLDAGADPAAVNKSGESGPITSLLAVGWYDAAIIKRLLAGGADPKVQDEDGRTALHEARTLEALNALLEAGADINAFANLGRYRGPAICRIAAEADDANILPMVKRLLELGAKVHGEDKDGKRWDIFEALSCNEIISHKTFVELGRLFSKEGADPRNGLTLWGIYNRIAELIDLGVDLSRNDSNEGGTILHTLTHNTPEEVVKKILAQGVDINAVDNNGNTALMLASKLSEPRLALILLRAGARTDITNKDGQTALDIAKKLRRTQVIQLLEKRK